MTKLSFPLLVALGIFIVVGISALIPLGIYFQSPEYTSPRKTEGILSLYYETKEATAPVKVELSGSYAGDTPIGRGLKGVWLRYRGASGTVKLTIGTHFNESQVITKYSGIKVGCSGHVKTSRHYGQYTIRITATFDVPATSVVPYWTPQVKNPFAKTDEARYYADRGLLPFQISVTVKISDVYYTIGANMKGLAYIRIVGAVEDYLPTEVPPEEPPEQMPQDEPEDMPPAPDDPTDDIEAEDTTINDEDGASILSYRPSNIALSTIALLSGVALTSIGAIAFMLLRRGNRKR